MNPILDDLDLAPVTSAPVQTPIVLDAEPVAPPKDAEQAIARQADDMVARAKAFVVDSPASYEQAGRMIDAIKAKRKDVEGFFAPMAEKAHAAWKALTEKRRSLTDPLDEAAVALSVRYSEYSRRMREEAEAERRRQEKEAQERERARLKAEAEAREREAEEARRAAERADTREDAQQLEAMAETMHAEAAVIKQEAATVEAPVLPLTSPIDHVKGPTVAQNWQHEVADFEALIRAVVAGQVSTQALLPNDTYLRQRAKADKGTAKIPGVRFFDAGSVRASRGRR